MSMRTRIVRRPFAVGSATRPSDDHLNAEAGSVTDWYVENFFSRLSSAVCTRSTIGAWNPPGSFAFSISSLTMSRSSAPPPPPGRASAAARAALLTRFTRSRVATSNSCWLGVREDLDFVDAA